MIRCTSCGYDNNDGSQRCLHCQALLPGKRENSDYANAMKTYHAAVEHQQEQQESLKKVIAVVIVVALIISAFGLYRAATAAERAETLVKNMLNNKYSNISSIECSTMSIPSEYATYPIVYHIYMTLYLDDGGTSWATATVGMDSYWADGKVTGLEVP